MPPTSHNRAPGFGPSYVSAYGMHHSFANRAHSPHRNLYGMGQPRHNQLLHVVLFKCNRADVFYIQEGTGLAVKPGDLVIVEADRGTDLGTVAEDNLDWATAKESKDHFAEEHYKWLMMYSQGVAATAQEGKTPSSAGFHSGGAAAGAAASAAAAASSTGPHHVQEPGSADLRPKLIKRLAQPHEVHALRDKEGQEAKAKRACMQKVKEHGLNVEILDAEFQMDWKKLTFYYFADSYINFNSLVTDLFKIYKTRIWMSAINPASFASPTLGIQAPSAVGPGAVGGPGAGRTQGGGDRRQAPEARDHRIQPYGPMAQAGRGFRPGANQPFGNDRQAPVPPAYPSGFAMGVGDYPADPVAGVAYNHPFEPGLHRGPGGMNFPPRVAFQAPRQRVATQQDAHGRGGQHSQDLPPIGPQADWGAAFQGLSLNTH